MSNQIAGLVQSQNQLHQTMEKMLGIMQENEKEKCEQNNSIISLQKQMRKLEKDKPIQNALRDDDVRLSFSDFPSNKHVATVIIDTEEGYIVDCNLLFMKRFFFDEDVIGPYEGSCNVWFRGNPQSAAQQKAFFSRLQNKTPSAPMICAPITKTGPEHHWKSYFVIFHGSNKYLQLSFWKE